MKFIYLIILMMIPIFLTADIEEVRTLKGKKIKIKVIRDVYKAKLVDIKNYIPDAVVDLKYNKRSRISKRSLYRNSTCLVNKYLAKRLMKIDRRLKKKYKMRLKFWDCYRPWSIQKAKWKRFHNKKYIEHPSIASKHTNGMSVDVTLTDLNNKELKMPTKYDRYSKKSTHKYKKLSKEIKKNRYILKNTMLRYGLSYTRNKWWNYSLKTKRKITPFDFSIGEYITKIEQEKKDRMFKENNKKNRDTTSISFNKNNEEKRDINQEISSNIKLIQNPVINCFIAESNRGNELPSQLKISYTIRKDGKFYDITIQDPKYKNKKDELNYCVLKSFKKINIKPISAPRLGSFPLEFSFE